MREVRCKPALVVALIISLLHIQIATARPKGSAPAAARAAFLGFKYSNIPTDLRETLQLRFIDLLMFQPAFKLSEPKRLFADYGQATVLSLLDSLDLAAVLAFGKRAKFDFIYAGSLESDRASNGQIHVTGTLFRYDVHTGQVQTFPVDQRYEKIGDTFLEFSDRYIQTLPPFPQKTSIWRTLLVGALIVTGALAISLLIGGTGGGEGEEEMPFPEDE